MLQCAVIMHLITSIGYDIIYSLHENRSTYGKPKMQTGADPTQKIQLI